MASGRAADREDPDKSSRNAARNLDRDPIREPHQGQRSNAPHQQAGHMTAPDHFAGATSKALAGGGRPHMIVAQPLAEKVRCRSSVLRQRSLPAGTASAAGPPSSFVRRATTPGSPPRASISLGGAGLL
jgi:hypothetical protein